MTAIKRNRDKGKKIPKRDPLVGVLHNCGKKQERINRERMYNYNLRLILIIVSMRNFMFTCHNVTCTHKKLSDCLSPI